MADTVFWTEVLDELEARLSAAESGEIAALAGWTRPGAAPRPMDEQERMRASGIAERQQALMASLATKRDQSKAALASMRRPRFKVEIAPPVYVDRAF